MRRGQRENATSAGREEGESVVVDKADRSCREGWWRASSNRVGNEERQQRRRQQRRHPLYSHEHVHTHMHSRTHASTYRYTCERARARVLPHPLSLSLSSSFYLFLGLFILLTLLHSDHPLLAVSLTIFLCTFTLFSPRCRLSPFLPFLSSSPHSSPPPTARRLSPYLSSYSSLLQCCRVGCAAASLAALSAALHGRDVLFGVCSPLCASRGLLVVVSVDDVAFF